MVEQTSERTLIGLSRAEVALRTARDGPNAVPRPRRPSRLRALAAQLTHFFALLLWAAGVLAMIAGMPQLGVAIFVVVVLNGAFAYAQEARAEHAAERLRDLLPRRATVVRDGETQTIDAAELVVDDVVVLDAGDRVSADLDVRVARGLLIDRSLLTGESVPDAVSIGETVQAGTLVVDGSGVGVVVATGGTTRLGEIAQLTSARQRPMTPLTHELHRVVRLVAVIAVAVGVGFFAISLVLGRQPRDGFLFAIGVTVALVPEGLLPTITLALAVGSQRMAARHALVRRLEAVETLGSATVICSDKTGTLTENVMSVVEVWTPAGSAKIEGVRYEPSGRFSAAPGARDAVSRLAALARASSMGRIRHQAEQWVAVGDPMEAAIDALWHRTHSTDELLPTTTHPFDATRRTMVVVAHDHGCDNVIVKGAPEAVLALVPHCDAAAAEVEALAARGLRVLAVASGALPPGVDVEARDELEHVELSLAGLLAFEDPIRPAAVGAIARCRLAGVSVLMLTGDHARTAAAVARQLGLFVAEDRVLDGDALPDDLDALGALVDRDGAVISRASPELKLRIALALQRRGHVVAMTGDGVNDGPALQAADIGVAMGRGGTDVAREAADLVLLDDDFATIVTAVEYGRATYANIRRFLTYHLTDNVAELTPFVVWALSGGRFPLAIGVLQVLCLDIGTDLLPALALGAEPLHDHRMPAAIGGQHLLDRATLRRVFARYGPVEAVVEMVAFVAVFALLGWRPGRPFPTGSIARQASGAAFAAVVFGQMATAFACRSTRQPAWRMSLSGNRFLLGAIVIELALLSMMLGVPPVAKLLGQAPPPLGGLAIAGLAAPVVLLVDAVAKRRRRDPTVNSQP